jgi:hypothetical protein
MPFFYEFEKREFVRVGSSVPVEYKFIALDAAVEVPDTLMKGETRNLGAGGILLAGTVPDPELISHLLMQKVALVVRIYLPDEPRPVQAIARVAWIEAVSQSDDTCCFGLCFREITSEAQNALFRFIIETRMA